MNFIHTKEAIERIKDIICKDYDRYIYDKDVAKELDMSEHALKMSKKRDKLPLKEIAVFCYKRELDIKKIIF